MPLACQRADTLLQPCPARVSCCAGGSITIGTGSSKLGETDYVSTVFRWIREAFPHPDHQLVNGAVGGVPSR